MSTAPKLKQRTSFTDKERQRLRRYHKSFPSVTPQQLACQFESEFGRKISKSSVYDILSDKYAYLDGAVATDAVRKKKGPQWAELELALFKWWQETRPSEVTGKTLKTKANEIWHTLSTCQAGKAPSFSDGWLSSWRARYGLSQSNGAKDIPQTCFEIESTKETWSESSANATCNRQSRSSWEFLDWTISDDASNITQHLEGTRFLHTPFKYPIHQAMSDSQIEWSRLSRTYAREPLPPSDRCNLGYGNRQHKATGSYYKSLCRAECPTCISPCHESGPNLALLPKRVKSVIDFNETLCNGIQELFLRCSTHSEDEVTLTGDIVLNIFKPVLRSLDIYLRRSSADFRWSQRMATASCARKVIDLLSASEIFKLRQSKTRSERFICEEWLLDFIDHRILRSVSPNAAVIEDWSSSTCSYVGRANIYQPQRLRCTTIAYSPTINKDGRIQVWTRNYTETRTIDDTHVSERFQANIVITPPPDLHSIPQTIIQWATQTTELTSILSIPIITFRKIIPDQSIIFNIAEYGTSIDLQMTLSRGEFSLYDCDQAGRSLINYALSGRNASTLKYLLTKIEDLDIYEPDSSGLTSSLLGILMGFDGYCCHVERDRRLMCLKLMLDAGADPSLLYYPCLENSTFELELYYGTVTAVEALLNLDHPCIGVNAPIGSTFDYEQLPLLSAAEHFQFLFDHSLHMNEKIYFLLRHGADTTARDRSGETCLHLVLMLNADMESRPFRVYQEEEFKDILMCMVTAGADICASDDCGKTVSQTAVEYGHEELWRDVLAGCGYDPDAVFSLEEAFGNSKDQIAFRSNQVDAPQNQLGKNLFSSARPHVRSPKLSFAEYERERKALRCVQKVYSREDVDIAQVWRECDEFWEACVETSESEDCECGSLDDQEYDDNNAAAECHGLLHNGVHWRSAFS